jgi:hypothetical protein
MGYELLSVVDLLNGTVRLRQSNPDQESAEAWIRAKFRLQNFQIRMHWGVQIFDAEGITHTTSEAVMLIRTWEDMKFLYRENFMKGLASDGFIYTTTKFEALSLREIKHTLNGLFLSIAEERHKALFSSQFLGSVSPICPKARSYETHP